jgi:uncharacterized lipoprotein YehR (DUF1307 family)
MGYLLQSLIFLYSIFAKMKKIIVALLIFLCFTGCSTNANYKQSAVEYLKTKVVNPASVDTIKFLKPDSIYSTFHDTQEYRALLNGYNSFIIKGDSAGVAEVKATVKEKEKSYKNVLTGWDVKLIYKAKDKKGVVKTDTCRFTFDNTLKIVKNLNGLDL